MPTHTIRETYSNGDSTVEKIQTKTATAAQSIEDESIGDGETDFAVAFTLDVSACKAFFMVSTQDVTIETNDGATPIDTISLVANVPYLWIDGSYHAFLLTTDVTGLFVTNDSGATAKLTVYALADPSP